MKKTLTIFYCTIGPLTKVLQVLFLRNKRFDVSFFSSDYQLRSAHATKHVLVAFGYFSTPPSPLLLYTLYGVRCIQCIHYSVHCKLKTVQVDPVELEKRTAFLRAQRDKLLELKRVEREKQLAEAEVTHAQVTKPVLSNINIPDCQGASRPSSISTFTRYLKILFLFSYYF